MAARGGAGQGPGVMVGGGGSWLGNGYLSLGFLSKSEEKWVPRFVGSVQGIPEQLCLGDYLGQSTQAKWVQDLAAMCQL